MIPLKDNIPNDRFPVVTIALIVINVIAYLISIRHGGSFFGGPSSTTVFHDAAIPYDLTHPGSYCTGAPAVDAFGNQVTEVVCKHGAFPGQIPTWQTAFTAMFLHGGFLHIAGNMIFLWIFGPNSTAPTLGASGAIAAVLGGYIVLYPRARILSLIFIFFFVTIIEVPALVILGFWFVEQAIFGAAGLANPAGGGGGVAYFAHVGGFVFGLAVIRLLAVHRQPEPPRYPVY